MDSGTKALPGLWFIMVAVVWLVLEEPGHADITEVASVIDADTIEIHAERIRLYGIDAPESCQTCEDASGRTWRCGQRAALALQDLIGRRTVSCQERDIDRYGRIVASVTSSTSTSASGSWARGWRWRIGGTRKAMPRPSRGHLPLGGAREPARSRLPGIGAENTAPVGGSSNLSGQDVLARAREPGGTAT
jgi:endonuclease YncB( thermonuclease family)